LAVRLSQLGSLLLIALESDSGLISRPSAHHVSVVVGPVPLRLYIPNTQSNIYPNLLLMWVDGAVILETTNSQKPGHTVPCPSGSQVPAPASPSLCVVCESLGILRKSRPLRVILRQDVSAGIIHFSILWLSLLRDLKQDQADR